MFLHCPSALLVQSAWQRRCSRTLFTKAPLFSPCSCFTFLLLLPRLLFIYEALLVERFRADGMHSVTDCKILSRHSDINAVRNVLSNIQCYVVNKHIYAYTVYKPPDVIPTHLNTTPHCTENEGAWNCCIFVNHLVSVWQEAMESSGRRRLFVTRILKQFDCDTFIPDIDPDKFKLLPE